MTREAERKRLVELIGNKPFTSEYENYNSVEWAENFADHLLDNGIVVPPLKMGDKVWIIDFNYDIAEYEVAHIRYNRDLNGQRYSYDAMLVGKNYGDIGFCDSDIGKFVFATREQAEKALEGKGE